MKTPIISRERVADLLCGALEGGSNYWYNLPDLTEVKRFTKSMVASPLVDKIINAVYDHNVSVPVFDIEDDENHLGDFNLANIARGEELMSQNFPDCFGDILKEQDDAETADVWFQLVVMGEVVYG